MQDNSKWEKVFDKLENDEKLKKLISTNPLASSLDEFYFYQFFFLLQKIREHQCDKLSSKYKNYLKSFESYLVQTDKIVNNGLFDIHKTRFRLKILINSYFFILEKSKKINAVELYFEFLKKGISDLGKVKNGDYALLEKSLMPFNKMSPELLSKIQWDVRTTLRQNNSNEDSLKISTQINDVKEVWDTASRMNPFNANPKETLIPKLKAPILGLFCYFVSQTIEPIGELNATDYCEKICNRYGLECNTNVRKRLWDSDSMDNRQKVKDLILPKIDEESRNRIEEYINTKYEVYH